MHSHIKYKVSDMTCDFVRSIILKAARHYVMAPLTLQGGPTACARYPNSIRMSTLNEMRLSIGQVCSRKKDLCAGFHERYMIAAKLQKTAQLVTVVDIKCRWTTKPVLSYRK